MLRGLSRVVSVPPHAVRTYIVSHDTVINMFYPTWSVLTKDRTLATRMGYYNTHITYACSDLHLIQSGLSHNLEKLSKWLVSNRLTLNTRKTEFMLICSRQRLSTLSDTIKLSIDNVPIGQVSSVKSLGI